MNLRKGTIIEGYHAADAQQSVYKEKIDERMIQCVGTVDESEIHLHAFGDKLW